MLVAVGTAHPRDGNSGNGRANHVTITAAARHYLPTESHSLVQISLPHLYPPCIQSLPQVIQLNDCFIETQGVMYLTDANASLDILRSRVKTSASATTGAVLLVGRATGPRRSCIDRGEIRTHADCVTCRPSGRSGGEQRGADHRGFRR